MLRRLVLCSLLAAPSAALQLSPLAVRPALARTRATLRAQEGGRYSEPILDESIDDPVYDVDSKYLGKVKYGFSSAAEAFNGRAAMMGFTICFFQETAFGKGVLELYHLPYDKDAVPQHLWDPSFLTGTLALIAAVGLFFGGTYGLILLNGGVEKAMQGPDVPTMKK